MRPIRLLFALSLTAAAVVFLPGRAFACSCIAPPPYPAAVADADAVFSGTVIDRFDSKAGANIVGSGDPIQYVFRVDAIAKGDIDPEQSIFSSRDSASCGYGFATDKRYLVFAYKTTGQGISGAEKGSLETHLCTKTTELGPNEKLPIDAQPLDVQPAGGTEAPAPGIPEIPSDDTGWLPMTLALATAAIVGGGAALLILRR